MLRYIHRLGKELNVAIAASLRRNADDADQTQFVAAIHLCKGVPFYGYHVGWRYFLKISFVDPAMNVRIATILQSGKVMGTSFQPYEIHIRYQLQFMLDYNLFGCSYIDLRRLFFRKPLPATDPYRSQDNSTELSAEQTKRWDELVIPRELVQEDEVHRNSFCELEADVHCADILNRLALRARSMHHNFDERDDLEGSEKLVPSLTGLWEEEQRRRLKAGLNPTVPKPESLGEKRQLRHGDAPKWLAEDRMRAALDARLNLEKQKMHADDRHRTTFTKLHPFDSHIVTTFESVNVLHGTYTGAPSAGISHRYDLETQAPDADQNLYDLEASLSQPSHSSNSPGAEEEAKWDVDEGFFLSQAFQQDMQEAEAQHRKEERADDDSEAEQEEAAARRRNEEKRKVVDLEREVVPSEPSTPFSSPFTTPTKRATPKQGTPIRKKQGSGEQSVSSDWRERTTSNSTDAQKTPRVRFADSDDGKPLQYSSESSKSISRLSGFSTAHTRSSTEGEGSSLVRLNRWKYKVPAPTVGEVTQSFPYFGLPTAEYKDPYFSDPADVPKIREYAGRTFTFASTSLAFLPAFEGGDVAKKEEGKGSVEIHKWEYDKAPPTRLEVAFWAVDEEAKTRKRSKQRRRRLLTQKAATTQPRDFGFKLSQRTHTSLVEREKQHMTVLAVEVIVCTRGKLMADPAFDPVMAIAYSFQHEDEALEDTGSRPGLRTGIILLKDEANPIVASRLGLGNLAIEEVDSELELFNALIDLVRIYDPEILVGWEIHSGSWGYLVERASREFDYEIIPELGRVNSHSTGSKHDHYGATQTSALRVTGRHVLNIWRLMRSELTLNQYSYENVVFHLLRRRVPRFSFQTITSWLRSGRPELQKRAFTYWLEKVETDLEVLEASELIFRTAEFARIYGVDFFSVISRGSQFKVESVMFRIAKPESFVLPSPSQQQVGTQNAAEDLPLILEPLSAFYKGPLLVLDFQSLYPSIMIAYNICYSTCLGRVSKFRDTWKLGFTEHAPPLGLLPMLKDNCFVSPNGLLYVKPNVRKSLLSKMLNEILDTRVMVKGSTKGHKSDRSFMRLQNARQLSLKLLANVTYGYTSASFSGRMPCVEVADSIVRYGRETLEKAIELIHGTPEWGAQVVYGDTDSLFIYLENRTKDEAFIIGNAIADAVTACNPPPVKLKFEKVYLPSVLLAKKRYVGFMYETPEDKEPVFNAKGIETVRRDGFPAQQRMVEACIRMLFRTQDLSLVKSYCQRQWRKIMEGKASIQDFIIAKEVRLGSYSENGVPPPGAALSARRMLLDKRSEPQYGERVPYLIRQGEPRSRLIDLAVSPETMLQDVGCHYHAIYYITRGLIPPLARVFNLLGADVESWFKEMPRVMQTNHHLAALMAPTSDTTEHSSPSRRAARNTLTSHYRTEHCLVCSRTSDQEICIDCRENAVETTFTLQARLHAHEARASAIARVCASCASMEVPGCNTPCISTDCPVLYEKVKTMNHMRAADALLQRHEKLKQGAAEDGAAPSVDW